MNLNLKTMMLSVDFEKELKTRDEILRQLEACCQGQITPEELNAAKESIRSGIRATHDSPGAIEAYYSAPGPRRTAAEYLEQIQRVTLEEVSAAARSLQLRSSYFLRGEAE